MERESCKQRASDQEAKIAKRRKAVLDLQEFFAKFAPEIAQLQKKDLRSVANSFQAKKHAEWMQAKNFFIRHFDFLALEEKDLLQDWELVLCDVSSLESVALLSGLQRCFERVDAFFKEHAETLKKLGAKNLDTVATAATTCTLYCFSIGLQVATHSICKVLSFTLKPKQSCSRLVTFIHHCFCSATCDSQQHISPIGFLF